MDLRYKFVIPNAAQLGTTCFSPKFLPCCRIAACQQSRPWPKTLLDISDEPGFCKGTNFPKVSFLPARQQDGQGWRGRTAGVFYSYAKGLGLNAPRYVRQ